MTCKYSRMTWRCRVQRTRRWSSGSRRATLLSAARSRPLTPYTLHPTPFTLHPTPYTLHPTPYTLHPTPCTLHPTPYTLYPQPSTLKQVQLLRTTARQGRASNPALSPPLGPQGMPQQQTVQMPQVRRPLSASLWGVGAIAEGSY